MTDSPRSHRPADQWSPLYFLASVGAGGLAVTFFMYLMFWVPHPGQPVPIFEDIATALATGSAALRASIALALVGIAVFGAANLSLLIWNLRQYARFTHSAPGQALRQTNAETQVMALPLALAMSINAMFILGLVFVPGLWGIVEYLFPAAMLAFLAVAVIAFRLYGRFLARVMASGGFDCAKNNSFAQMLPAFAFAMVGVGLAAPSAMSVTPLIAGTSLILSSFFLITATAIAAVGIIFGLRSILENGVAAEQAPTLMMVIPLSTVLGILMLRQSHGLHMHFDVHGGAGETLMMLTRLMSVEILFALFGLLILGATGYARRFMTGAQVSPGNYALICPGVALSVLMHFWINKGLVATGMIAKFGSAYWALSGVAIALQVSMIVLMAYLHLRHFLPRTGQAQTA